MDLDTMLDEAAPARHVRLDGPYSPAAVSLYRQIIAQPPAAARARRRYRLAIAVIAGACAIVALALTFISAPARHGTTAVAILNQAALTAARQPAVAVPGPGQYVYVETIEGQRDGAGICIQTVRVWTAPDGSGREVASAPTGAFCHGGIPSQTFTTRPSATLNRNVLPRLPGRGSLLGVVGQEVVDHAVEQGGELVQRVRGPVRQGSLHTASWRAWTSPTT